MGELTIGDLKIACAVLPTRTRVLSQRAFTKALGAPHGGHAFKKRIESGVAGLPIFLASDDLKPYIDLELAVALSSPIEYVPKHGGRSAFGIKAELVPAVCDVWLKAREAGTLSGRQLAIAKRAEILMRGLAHIGIIALVDEATGYQEIRDKEALQAILDAFLAKELAAWAKRFPDEFYEQVFRLRGWEWRGRKVNPPQALARYTKDLVYERLAPHLVEELEKRNPIENGRRRAKHHQWLTDDIGHPALAQHLHAVIVLMRVSNSWEQFKGMLDTSLPRRGDTLKLPFMAEPST